MNTVQPFDVVVETHSAIVLRMCASVLGPGADAEDAWSETFLAALRAHPLDPEVNVEAWLVRVARNKAVDILRRRVREHPSNEHELSRAADPTSGNRPSGVRELSGPAVVETVGDFDDELWSQVGQLSERQQFVVAHRFIAQWSYPEIAEKLHCTPAAARRCGADAIAALRRLRDVAGGVVDTTDSEEKS